MLARGKGLRRWLTLTFPYLRCKAKLISVHGKKAFTDMQGNEIFTLSKKMISIHPTFLGETPDGKSNFEIKGHFKLIGSKSSVHFKNAADGKDVELNVKGDWFDRSAEITWEGRPIAVISRSFFNAREFFGDKQTYFVAVAANVDLSLIAAICISLDEKENDD